ncbi:MAG: homocysteine S-methyltransferase family protein [Clostridia bacterium]|jgi:S-methylmethionine-dependent homocysteine/selenocysteine methylase|nr:homocysteine S-methyltransferase family protein [Clostridia bacterium]MCI1999392.1 homocysteine S-methyltransferase family protein [Clostridia bacterium]MCI2015106.1 homocysteine S-methyltransferase family protein [Clostridia bacterium]
MDIINCFLTNKNILMEGALGERLKREYNLSIDGPIAMAGLVYTSAGRKALKELWEEYISIARIYKLPFLATTPTRRANIERIKQVKLDESVIYDNVRFLKEIKAQSGIEMYVGGLMGCRGDAYTGEGALDEKTAKEFHSWQAEAFKKAGVDFLYAGIMPNLNEAEGMAEAMAETKLPYIISFTIQKNGKLIDGTTIDRAISEIDLKAGTPPLCYMTNCVHPTVVYEALSQPFNMTDRVRTRFKGIQANTSPLSYSELDGSADLKCSEPDDFARDMIKLKNDKHLKILGGCCGTDNRHMAAIAKRM